MAKTTRQHAANQAASSIAPAGAAIFTNPIEVCKVRQQLDQPPRSLFTTMQTVYAKDGFGGLQAGLRISLFREASKTGFRIGLYDPILRLFHDPSRGSAPMHKRMLAGMSSGATAALVCNPIELVKTRQQAAAGGASAHAYAGPIDGLRQLLATEGFGGLWRGTGVSMLRSAAVTGPHLTTYTGIKEFCVDNGILRDGPPLHMLSSLCGALTGIMCNQPMDVVRNRLYSQPVDPHTGRGSLYTGAADCVRQLVQAEGVLGLYRGFTSHYLRVGPHYVITFVFLEQLKKLFGA